MTDSFDLQRFRRMRDRTNRKHYRRREIRICKAHSRARFRNLGFCNFRECRSIGGGGYLSSPPDRCCIRC
jgi:hypothetical protein